MFIRSRFSIIPRVSISFDPSERRTKSEFLKETDINNIMARYKKTGVLPDSALSAKAQFGDFSQVPTYQEMHEKVSAANAMFDALPSAVRKEFRNDPHAFISAADTPQGRILLAKLGLAKPDVSSVSKGSVAPISSVPESTLVDPEPAAGVAVPSKKVK